RLVLTTLVLLLLAAAPARADAPRTRDGFYLRLGLGGSGLSMSRSGHVSAGGSAPTYVGDSSIAGGGGALELVLGGTLRPGLVLAGTIVYQNVSDPSLHSNSGDVPL